MPSYSRAEQAKRYIRLTIALSTRGYRTHELISKFGMCKKTVIRDMRALEEIGIPVYYDKEMRDDNTPVGVWRVDPHWMKRFM